MTPAGVVLDLDGVLLAAGAPIPAPPARCGSATRGPPCAVLTNMTRPLPQDISGRLAAAGIELPAERIVTAAVATAEYLRRLAFAGARVLLVAERGSERQFAGLQLVAGPPADLVVVGGPDESWTLSLLDDALRALQGGARLVAMQGNAWWLAADGARLDSGSYVKALAHAAGVRPRVIGKPAAAIFRTRLPRAGPASGRLRDGRRRPALGRAGGPARGLRGVLVRTGKGASASRTIRAPPRPPRFSTASPTSRRLERRR